MNIRGKGKGDPGRIAEWVIGQDGKRPADIHRYTDTVYRMAPALDLNPDVVISQWLHETADRATGSIPAQSVPWDYGANPAGIGVTSDAEWRRYDFGDGERAARAHLLHLYLYVHGANVPTGFAVSDDPRWLAAIAAGYAGTVQTTEGLAGKWAADDDYAAGIQKWYDRLANAGLLSGVSTEEPMSATKAVYVLLVDGHRSEGDGGNDTERQLTDDLGIAYRDRFRRGGYTADILQELETGNPRGLIKGGLNGVATATARRVKAAIDRGFKLVVVLDLHFNGRRSGVHVLVAHNRRQDGRGTLTSGYVAGRITDDLFANNGLDVQMAGAIARGIAAIPGMTLWRASGSGIDGVMLENESGVGNNDGQPPDNARLAMMAAPAPYRMNAVRLTVEHGGTDDASKPDFFTKAAEAAFRAVDPILQTRYGTSAPPEPEVPDEDDPETPPTGDPGTPTLAEWAFGEAAGYQFDPNGPVSKLWLAIGAVDGEYPRLDDVMERDGAKYFLFRDGMIIRYRGGKVEQVKDITAA